MFTLKLEADNSTFYNDHDKTEWEIYQETSDKVFLDIFKKQHYKRNRLDKRAKKLLKEYDPIYSITTTKDLATHYADLPIDHFDLNWGGNYFYIRFRFHSVLRGWGNWSPIWPMVIDKAKEPVRAFDRGPIERKDNTKGISHWNWMVELREDGIYIARENIRKTDWRTPELLFTPDPPTSDVHNFKKMIYLDLTFDQNGRPVVCYEVLRNSYLYWYDSNVEDFVITKFENARCPKVSIDLRKYYQEVSGDESDFLFFYIDIDNDKIVYRRQRDRFETKYDVLDNASTKYLKLLDNTKDSRFIGMYIEKGETWPDVNKYLKESCWNYGVFSSAPLPIFGAFEDIKFNDADIEEAFCERVWGTVEAYTPFEYVVFNNVEMVSGLRRALTKYIYPRSDLSSDEYENALVTVPGSISGEGEVLLFSNTEMVSGLRRELIKYMYTPYEYIAFSNAEMISGLREELIIYKHSPYEYIAFSNAEMIGGSRYVP